MRYQRQRMAWPWNWGIGRSRSLKMAPFIVYDFELVGHCKYSCMLYRFQLIWRWIIVTLKRSLKRSLKVIQTGTNWKQASIFIRPINKHTYNIDDSNAQGQDVRLSEKSKDLTLLATLFFGCGLLFVFHSNYGRIFNRLWDIQRQKIAWPWKQG